jgi:hypothetical protein
MTIILTHVLAAIGGAVLAGLWLGAVKLAQAGTDRAVRRHVRAEGWIPQ